MGRVEVWQLLDKRLLNKGFRKDMDTLLRPGLVKFDVDAAAQVVRSTFFAHPIAP
jgi:hypothetical protein